VVCWVGFYYFVQIDQEEAALLGLTLTYEKIKSAEKGLHFKRSGDSQSAGASCLCSSPVEEAG
jgi:hypothetical protein